MKKVILRTGENFPKIKIGLPRGYKNTKYNKDGLLHWRDLQNAYDPNGDFRLYFVEYPRFTRHVNSCGQSRLVKHRRVAIRGVRKNLVSIAGEDRVGPMTWRFQYQDWDSDVDWTGARSCWAASFTFIFGLVDVSQMGENYDVEFEHKSSKEIEDYFRGFDPVPHFETMKLE